MCGKLFLLGVDINPKIIDIIIKSYLIAPLQLLIFLVWQWNCFSNLI